MLALTGILKGNARAALLEWALILSDQHPHTKTRGHPEAIDVCTHGGRLGAQGGEGKAKSEASAEANELMPWQSSGFHNGEKRNNRCLSHPTCRTLLWQPFIQLRPLESIYC